MTLVAVNMRAEAAAEVRRLTKARALLRDGDQRALAWLDDASTWIAMPRRPSLRRKLGHHLCLVWLGAAEDRSGRIVESRLVAVLVAVPAAGTRTPPSWRRAWIRSLLPPAEFLVRPIVEAEIINWRSEVARVTDAITSARLRREHDIARPATAGTVASQPGLFDRRTDRANREHADAAGEADRTAAQRLQAIEAGGAIAFRAARLLLVLVP